jgi:hypothetical protein
MAQFNSSPFSEKEF